MARPNTSSKDISISRPKARELRLDSKITMAMPTLTAEIKKNTGRSGEYQ